MDEPSVLDYVKARLMPWRGPAPEIPAPAADEAPAVEAEDQDSTLQPMTVRPAADPAMGSAVSTTERLAGLPQVVEIGQAGLVAWPWRSGAALFFALLAQRALEPPDRGVPLGLGFYALAAVLLVWATVRGEWEAIRPADQDLRTPLFRVRLIPLASGLFFGFLAYLLLGDNRFTSLNVLLWGLSIGLVLWSVWLPDDLGTWVGRLRVWLQPQSWAWKVTPQTLAALAVVAVVVYFRVYRLGQVPPEMFSDHAEKLQDVMDVLNGQFSIFFPRNTGREAFQMYLTAAVARLFGTGLSFMSLKIGTALAGLVTLPFVYLLGKEVANRNVGLLAVLFCGVAYWPNVITRVALRFSLYPLFAAPTLYFLFKGLRRRRWNDLLLAGLFLGLGLHGYSPFRFMPVVVVAIVGMYLLHRQSRGARSQVIVGLILLALVSFLVFLPLFRYAVDEPEMFALRTLSRMGTTEKPLDSAATTIFFENLWEASIMFFWSNGQTWVHSVVFRPALDVVSAALFFLGLIILVLRYARKPHWMDLSLLISIPLLMMPSILSLAFPDENPSLNRTAGAMVPVFIVVAIALESLVRSWKARWSSPYAAYAGWAVAGLLLLWSATNNYDLVFNQYFRQFQLSAWNTSEIGRVIGDFAASVGDRDSAWVVPNAHWVDTRLVGINAGFPEKDYALWPEDLHQSVEVQGPKLFIVRPTDELGQQTLRELYPNGTMTTYPSAVETKDFMLYFVPE